MSSPKPMAKGSLNSELFQGIIFYINDSVQYQARQKLHTLLTANGATAASPPSPRHDSSTASPPPRFDSNEITHFITDSLDFPEYATLRPSLAGPGDAVGHSKGGQSAAAVGEDEQGVKIVLPTWVTRSYDLQTLQQPRFYSPDRQMIYAGLCFCTSELPSADSQAIAAGVQSLGGQFRTELTREVTHLFVVAPSGPKYESALKFGNDLGMIIVLPHWFEDTLKLGQLVPTDPYRFPDPPMITNLRDGTKPFEERLAEYWKVHPGLNPPRSVVGGVAKKTATMDLLETTTAAITATAAILGDDSKTRGLASGAYQTSCTVEPRREQGVDGTTSLARGGRAGTASTSASVVGSHHAGAPAMRDAERCSTPIFAERRVYLASDLSLRPGLEEALQSRIREAGGTCWSWGVDGGRLQGEGVHRRGGAFERRRVAEEELKRANTVVTRTREGWEFWHAYDSNKTIGNLSWLYHVLATAKLDSPLDRLLHYPLPSLGGIPEFQGKVITISNYAGGARDYVRAMIEALGARFEGAMSKMTDFVVTASEYGAKVKHARSWSVPLVSHLWLEACLLEWRFIPPSTSSTYLSDASTSTNFTSILGNTNLPRGAIEKWVAREEVQEMRREGGRDVLLDAEEEEGEEQDEQDGMEVLEEEREQEEVRAPEPGKAKAKGKGKGKGRAVEVEVEPEPDVEVDVEVEQPEPRAAEDDAEAMDVDQEDEEQAVAEADEDEDDVAVEEQDVEEEEDEEPIRSPPKRKTTKRVPDDSGDDSDGSDQPKQKKAKASPKSKSKKKEASSSKVKSKPPPSSSSSSSSSAPANEVKLEPVVVIDVPASSARKPTPTRRTSTSAPNVKTTPKPANKRRRRASASTSDSSSSEKTPPPSAKAFGKTFGKVDPENVIPRSRRAAAGTAAALLAQQMPDAIRFAAEIKSSGKKGKGGRRSSMSERPGKGRKMTEEEEASSDEEEGEEEEERKPTVGRPKGKGKAVPVVKVKKGGRRSRGTEESEEVEVDEIEEEEEKVEVQAKPKKKGRAAQVQATATTTQDGAISSFDNPPKGKPAVKSRKTLILSTGLGLDKNHPDIKALKSLGASWTEQPSQVTHLVVKGMSRTEKFLSCLGYVPYIVNKQWIDASIKAGRLVDESPYLLKDPAKEKEVGDSLVAILERARTKKLFEGVTVYVTKGVQPDPTTMQRILQSGNAVVNTAKLSTTICANILKTHNDDKATGEADLSPRQRIISCPGDRQQWEGLAAKGVPIYSVEAVFQSVLLQDTQRGFKSGTRVDLQLRS